MTTQTVTTGIRRARSARPQPRGADGRRWRQRSTGWSSRRSSCSSCSTRSRCCRALLQLHRLRRVRRRGLRRASRTTSTCSRTTGSSTPTASRSCSRSSRRSLITSWRSRSPLAEREDQVAERASRGVLHALRAGDPHRRLRLQLHVLQLAAVLRREAGHRLAVDQHPGQRGPRLARHRGGRGLAGDGLQRSSSTSPVCRPSPRSCTRRRRSTEPGLAAVPVDHLPADRARSSPSTWCWRSRASCRCSTTSSP